MKKKLSKGQRIRLFSDEMRSPVSTRSTSKGMLIALEDELEWMENGDA